MGAAPGFTAAAVATLALGFGLTSAVLSLAYALFFKRGSARTADLLVPDLEVQFDVTPRNLNLAR